MIKRVMSWNPEEMPDLIRVQILAYMREEWPEGFVGDNLMRNWIHPSHDHPRHFVGLLSDEVVAAHASALWREFTEYGERWKIGGLSGVFAYRHLQGEGWGKAVVEQATLYLHTLPLDAALFCTENKTVPFYEKLGWELLPGNPLSKGDPPELEKGATLFRSLGERGRELKKHLLTSPLYFGNYTW